MTNNIGPFTYEYPKADSTASVIAYEKRGDELHLLAIRRRGEPFKGHLALPGGFLEIEKENLEQCAARELAEETSLSLDVNRFQLVCVHSSPDRDPRGHVIDHVYAVQLTATEIDSARAADDAASVERVIVEPGSALQWAFDHADAVAAFLSQRAAESRRLITAFDEHETLISSNWSNS